MALPNPNDKLITSSETQTLTLKDLLFYQKESEKWSQNTDVNTFRGNVEEQEQGEKLVKAIGNLRGSEGKGSLEKVEEVLETNNNKLEDAFARLGKTFSKPFRGLVQNLNETRFNEFGESMFSATDLVASGAERVSAGFKELTNGIGAIGPAVNAARTFIYKLIAGFNVFFGAFQLVAGSIAKLGQKLINEEFIPRINKWAGTTFGSLESKEKKFQEEKKLLQAEEDKAKAELEKTEEELKQLQEGKKVMNAEPPLPVVFQGGASDESPQLGGNVRVDEQGDVDGNYDPMAEQKAINEKREEALEKFNKAQKANEDFLQKKKIKNENTRFKAFRGLIAKLNLFSLTGFLKIMAIAAGIGGLVMGLKEGVKGTFSATGQIIRSSITGAMKGIDEAFKKAGLSAKGIEDQKPGTKGNRVPKGQQVKIDGKVFKGGQYLPAGTQVSASGEVFKEGVKQGAVRNTLRTVSKIAPPIATVAETGMDLADNRKKFQAIKERFESGEKLYNQDGTVMTKEDMTRLEAAQNANIAGSVGRGVGGLGGAAAGAKAGAVIGTFFGGPIGTAVGGLLGAIGGGIAGAFAGDSVATGTAEMFTGTEDSQQLLNEYYNQLGDELEEANRQVSDGNVEMQTRQMEPQYYNQQQVVNNQNDTISVGKTPFSNTQLEYSYGN